MNKLLAMLLAVHCSLFTLLSSAAVPQHWTVETSRVQPAQFGAYHGETIEFAATMQSYGKPLAITNNLIGIYWQTNGMGSAYWTAPATLSNNVMIARWTPEMDVGANVYNCFIGAPGEIYRAAFQLWLRPSPGANPAELPLPVKTLDFAKVQVLNAPYYSKSETDAKIIELAPAPGNYAVVSNAAMTAVQPAAISDMETRTHAAETYQPKGSYLTSESDPTVPSWAKATTKPSYTAGEVGVTMESGTQSVAITVGSSAATMPTFDFFSQMLTYKQDTISDLANIRSGAALGATAVQPSAISDMETRAHAAATYQPQGSYLTSETDPSVDGKIATHNSSDSSHGDIRNSVAAIESKGDGWDHPEKVWNPQRTRYTTQDGSIYGVGSPYGQMMTVYGSTTNILDFAFATNIEGQVQYYWQNSPSENVWIAYIPDDGAFGGNDPSRSFSAFYTVAANLNPAVDTIPTTDFSFVGGPIVTHIRSSGVIDRFALESKVPRDATVASWGYIKSYAETDPTVDGKISTHNSSSSAHSDIRTAAANAQAHSEATRQIVYTWEDFLDGSNVVISITNHVSGAYSLDHAKLQIKELTPGAAEYRIVYDSRTEITNHTEAAKRQIVGYVDGVVTELRGEIADKGDKAWGRRSSTGHEVPVSNTVWVTEQNLRIAGGMEYERVAVGEGAIYVLTSKGQTPYMTGDEGALMLKDDGGTNYFGMVRSDSYTIGCNTDGIRVENDLVYLDFSVTMSDHPCVWYTESLGGDVEWEQLNLPDGSAVPGASHVVVWDESPRLGAQECYINCENKPGGFFRATIEVAGDARFRANMPAEIPSFYCADNPDKKVKIIWNNGNPKFVEAQ